MTAKEQALLAHLEQFLTDERKELFGQVVQSRTYHLTLVLENIFQAHNASAVLRSCESMGVQNAHIITERYGEYEVNQDVVAGAAKWLHIHQHPTTVGCLAQLKSEGYKIVATSPHATQTLDDISIDDKTAFVFGAEVLGVSDYTMSQADATIAIPMFGFTESFNISVSAALCIRSFIQRLHPSDVNWRLSQEEQDDLRLEWVKLTLREVEKHERYFEEKVWPKLAL